MSSSRLRPDNRHMAQYALDRVAVLEDIRALTATPTPRLEQVERTLADGYACALGIEATRIRMRRELEGSAAGLSNRAQRRVDEVAGLARGIAQADEELAELRAALVDLAKIARGLRTP
jgi:hypothetical protein